jgi:hypothetical protein
MPASIRGGLFVLDVRKLIRFRELNQQRLQLGVVRLVVRKLLSAIAQRQHLLLDLVALCPHVRRQRLLGVAADQVGLVSDPTIGFGAVVCLLDQPDASKEVSSCALAVAGVVEQRVLGREPTLGFVELLRLPARKQERLEQRRLPVLIEIKRRIAFER